MAEPGQLAERVGEGNDGSRGADVEAFSAVDAPLFDHDGFPSPDADSLGRASPQALHPTLALFLVKADGMIIILTHPLLS
jgi:hypothetical protein